MMEGKVKLNINELNAILGKEFNCEYVTIESVELEDVTVDHQLRKRGIRKIEIPSNGVLNIDLKLSR